MKQFARYAIVGGLSNLTGYFVYLLLTWFYFEPKMAMTLVYLTGATVGFLGNRQWTFVHNGKILPTLSKYLFAHACGYCCNYMILYLFVDRMGYPHEVVQAVAILVVATLLFIVMKKCVFVEKEHALKGSA